MTLTIRYDLLVSYGQICIFDAHMEKPFNDWSDAHVQQGFAWRPGSVSFGVLESTMMAVEIEARRSFELSQETVRAISVPFTVAAHGDVAVASIGVEQVFNLEPGEYRLIYELWDLSCRFTFIPGVAAPAILRADAELASVGTLCMEACPAI